jgi:hypothetical protein
MDKFNLGRIRSPATRSESQVHGKEDVYMRNKTHKDPLENQQSMYLVWLLSLFLLTNVASS